MAARAADSLAAQQQPSLQQAHVWFLQHSLFLQSRCRLGVFGCRLRVELGVGSSCRLRVEALLDPVGESAKLAGDEGPVEGVVR